MTPVRGCARWWSVPRRHPKDAGGAIPHDVEQQLVNHKQRTDRLRALDARGALTFVSSTSVDGVRHYTLNVAGHEHVLRRTDVDAFLDGLEAGIAERAAS